MSISIQRSILVVAVLMFTAPLAFSQTSSGAGPIRSSAAYAEVLLRKTELLAELESVLSDYTEQNPKIIDVRFEIGALSKEIDRLFAVRPSETSKLSSALGKMMVRKAELESDLHRLQRTYSADHPEVKRMKRKVEIFAAAIKEILG